MRVPVQTKLYPPQSRKDAISRPRLLAALREGLTSRRLILLSTPAGYGKSTLLAALPSACPDLPLTWLTLDRRDNDPTLFLTYLIATLQRLNPECGSVAQALLSGPAAPTDPGIQTQRIIGVLINEVMEILPQPFALILDDLHLISEPVVYATLDYLLERLPPQMHWVVASRYDPPLPLARLRARGQLAELRLADLAFTYDETAAFLNDTLHLGLSPGDLEALQARTEGWPAGLRLLAGSLAAIPTPAGRSAFIADLARTDRYVFDFLADEVLSRQDRTVRTFLLETSILTELTPSLCRAVTGRSDAGAVLENLYHHGLFVVAVDPARTTFRYHALFAEFLRQCLEREMGQRVTELHCRAARAQAASELAIDHYLAAGMWEQAAQAIEQVGPNLLRQSLLDTLTGWIHALPAPVRDARPRLSYFLGICAWQKEEPEEARSLLEQALRGFEAVGDKEGQGEALVHLATCALLQADYGLPRGYYTRHFLRPTVAVGCI